MKRFLSPVGFCVLTMLLAACGSANGGSVTPVADTAARHASSSYKILHSFGSSGDGVGPTAGLLYLNAMLYGTTDYGGSGGRGTVFALKTKGTGYNVLYSFPSDWSHGALPQAGLIDVNGVMYGTTIYGGTNPYSSCYAPGPNYGCGVVFKITTGGSESVVYSFANGVYGSNVDGTYPLAPLVYVNGTLYGATQGGGPNACNARWPTCGTIFGIGAYYYSQLLAFNGSNGASPSAAPTYVNGSFYGTTSCGGTYGTSGCGVGGTIFRIGFAGKEKVLHSFGYGNDGNQPLAPAIDANGTLYGTTCLGGKYGNGTVYSISPSGSGYTTLYSFGSSSNDGACPYEGALLDVKGTLYGTTANGGAFNKGTIFSITTAGNETVLYSFGASSKDGASPDAGLIDVKNTLYGTTNQGGSANDGTVFAYKL